MGRPKDNINQDKAFPKGGAFLLGFNEQKLMHASANYCYNKSDVYF